MRNQLAGVLRLQSRSVDCNGDVRIEIAQAIICRFRLPPLHIIRAVEKLAVQIGKIDHVVVDDADRPHSRSGQIKRRRRAQPAGADT